MSPDQVDLKSLELLFEYTKFHIGAYLTVAASFITLASLKNGEDFALPLSRPLVYLAMVLFMIAGLAGGVIVSTITQCYGLDSQSTSTSLRCASTVKFMALDMGPGDGTLVSYKGERWIHIEHFSFWLGLLAALGSYLFAPRQKPASPKPPLAVQVEGKLHLERDAASLKKLLPSD